ncbi:hypothetical protein EIP91_006919 [Steccherinum ochraceum]|uniref:F-box domain-containing protein n=1 Tax=Steccherinum ochraceum TaxID=92696 RepID=A0A4R0RFJ0_9APHY|nr:hypothetical protein EIP91_006919 [Steccherinum ochraceum]
MQPISAGISAHVELEIVTPTSPLRLPLEICERIIDFLAPASTTPQLTESLQAIICRNDLYSCMRACPAWIPRCQFHLMEVARFVSRYSLIHYARQLRRSPESRQRIKSVVISQDEDDHSWVSAVPLLLPLKLDNLTLEAVDLSALHPMALQRLHLLQVSFLMLKSVHYSYYYEVARLVKFTSARRAIWVLDHTYIPDSPGVVRGVRTSLRDAEVYATWMKQVANLLRNFILFSSSPMSLKFFVSGNEDDNVYGFNFITDKFTQSQTFDSSTPRRVLGPIFPRPAFSDLPKDHRSLWNHVFRTWQMNCCRDVSNGLLESMAITVERNAFRLTRKFEGENYDQIGPSTLEIIGSIDNVHLDFVAYANCVIRRLSALEIQEVIIPLMITPRYLTPNVFECLDDALNHPNFAGLVRVTLIIRTRLDSPIQCELDFGPELFPRTYARGLIFVARCERPECQIHSPSSDSAKGSDIKNEEAAIDLV